MRTLTLTLNSAREIPIGNIKAWLNLQLNDPAISEAINHRKRDNNPEIKDNNQEKSQKTRNGLPHGDMRPRGLTQFVI